MDNTAKLKITERAKGSKGAMHRLRNEGLLPASMSRKGHGAVSFAMKKDEFRKAFGAIGMSGIYTLQGEKKTAYTAMIREIQHVPGSYDFLHITFQSISLTEETTADIHLHIVGRDELIHNGHELQQQLETVHLKGLPGDFPASVEIDVSKMVPGDQVTVADLKLPKGIISVTDSDRLILSIPHPRIMVEETAEEQATPAEAAAAPAESSEAANK